MDEINSEGIRMFASAGVRPRFGGVVVMLNSDGAAGVALHPKDDPHVPNDAVVLRGGTDWSNARVIYQSPDIEQLTDVWTQGRLSNSDAGRALVEIIDQVPAVKPTKRNKSGLIHPGISISPEASQEEVVSQAADIMGWHKARFKSLCNFVSPQLSATKILSWLGAGGPRGDHIPRAWQA